jgi:hypothetical protein
MPACVAMLFERYLSPHPEEPGVARRAKTGVSKDEAQEPPGARASWFETDCCAILLTMRV